MPSVQTTTANDANPKNRRKRDRLELSLPIRVHCRESREHEWEEITRLIDVTPFGAGFSLSRPMEVGRLILLVMPLPRQLRCYDHLEPQYKMWALVRHVRKISDEKAEKQFYNIGVAFVGKRAPASYEADPTTLYEVQASDELGFCRLKEISGTKGTSSSGAPKKDLGADGRRMTRHPIPLTVRIEVFDENGKTVSSEMTVTENVNQAGAAVFTTLDVDRGRFVRMTCDQYNITVVAVVRRRRIGADGIARLHLEFIDRQFPLEGIGV
ncbi:MAG: hypothetical protein M3209_06820 [Acidobacteriota bacterium]|nr:hypothetical protein [Acidobacteriota bacterium]